MFPWLRLLALSLLVVTPLSGCSGEVQFSVNYETETTVEGGGLFASVLDLLPVFPGLTSFDVSSQEEFANHDTRKELVKEARLTAFELSITEPAEGDFDFIDEISFYLSAPELDRILVASKTVPRGVRSFSLDVEDTDLAEYVRAESMTFTTEVSGRQPVEDTVVKAALTLDLTAALASAL